MRPIGLDVHRDLCEIAIAEGGATRSAGRIATRPEVLELFAQSLATRDQVVLEVTGNAGEIARIFEPHVARVVVVSSSDTGILPDDLARSRRRAGRRSDVTPPECVHDDGRVSREWAPNGASAGIGCRPA